MGRSRDQGNARYATVTESAEALGVTAQAIYNRIKAKTIPYEDDIDSNTQRHSYRIPRDWLEREVMRRSEAATNEVAQQRTLDIVAAFDGGVEILRSEVEKIRNGIGEVAQERNLQHGEIVDMLEAGDQRITGAIEGQVAQVVPRLDALLTALGENADRQRRMLGWIEELKNAEAEEYKLLRKVVARAEEEDRREREYQQSNLELQRKNGELQRQTLELLSRVEKTERERAEQGQKERRGFFRRLFSGD